MFFVVSTCCLCLCVERYSSMRSAVCAHSLQVALLLSGRELVPRLPVGSPLRERRLSIRFSASSPLPPCATLLSCDIVHRRSRFPVPSRGRRSDTGDILSALSAAGRPSTDRQGEYSKNQQLKIKRENIQIKREKEKEREVGDTFTKSLLCVCVHSSYESFFLPFSITVLSLQ